MKRIKEFVTFFFFCRRSMFNSTAGFTKLLPPFERAGTFEQRGEPGRRDTKREQHCQQRSAHSQALCQPG